MIMNKQRTMQSIIRTIRETDATREKSATEWKRYTDEVRWKGTIFIREAGESGEYSELPISLCEVEWVSHTPLERNMHFGVLLIGRSGVKFHLLFAYKFVYTWTITDPGLGWGRLVTPWGMKFNTDLLGVRYPVLNGVMKWEKSVN